METVSTATEVVVDAGISKSSGESLRSRGGVAAGFSSSCSCCSSFSSVATTSGLVAATIGVSYNRKKEVSY